MLTGLIVAAHNKEQKSKVVLITGSEPCLPGLFKVVTRCGVFDNSAIHIIGSMFGCTETHQNQSQLPMKSTF